MNQYKSWSIFDQKKTCLLAMCVFHLLSNVFLLGSLGDCLKKNAAKSNPWDFTGEIFARFPQTDPRIILLVRFT
jgi:hypothetical protein